MRAPVTEGVAHMFKTSTETQCSRRTGGAGRCLLGHSGEAWPFVFQDTVVLGATSEEAHGSE